MKKILLACCLFGVGCSDASKKVEEFADKVCACKDQACTNTAWNEFVAWAEANKDARGDEEKAEREMTRMAGCAQKNGIDEKVYNDGLNRLVKLAP